MKAAPRSQEARDISGTWSAGSLARHTRAVLQCAFILAKASGNAEFARESVDYLKRNAELLFDVANDQSNQLEKRKLK